MSYIRINILKTVLFISFGVLITSITAYFGVESIILGMHIPILLAGFLLPINFSAACSFITPILCSVFIGVPAVFPALPLIVCEAVALASFANIFYTSLGWRIYPALFATIPLGLLVLFCAASILSWVIDGFSAVAFTFAYIAEGFPGIILQIALIPLLIKALKRISLPKKA